MDLPVNPLALTAFSGVWSNFVAVVVVIALATRRLPPDRRLVGIALGAGAAVAAQILVALASGRLLEPAYLRVGGGLLLIGIAALLAAGARPRHDEEGEAALAQAIAFAALAGFVASLDRIAPLGAAARGQPTTLALGLALAIPAIMACAALASTLLERFPASAHAGGAALGWIAGGLLVSDPDVMRLLAARATELVTIDPVMPIGFVPVPKLHYAAAFLGALAALLPGLLRQGQERRGDAARPVEIDP